MKPTQTNKSKLSPVAHKIPRNVNSYRHLISLTEGSAEIINFALQLRSPDQPINLKKIPDVPFSVYGKTTEGGQHSRKVGDYDLTMNQESVSHIYKGKSVGHRAMAFSQGLRRYAHDSNTIQEEDNHQQEENKQKKKKIDKVKREKEWNVYSRIERNYYPSYVDPINTQSNKHLSSLNERSLQRGMLTKRSVPRVINAAETYCGFEGHSNYPAYNSKMPLHNMSEYKFLLRDKKDVNKNTMGWVSQLRSSYTNEPLHRITNAKQEKTKKEFVETYNKN